MAKRFVIVLFVLLALGGQAFAQSSVSGKVTDETGDPLVGVNVLIKGTTTGNMTDLNGLWNLNNVKPESVLVFSCLGYKTQEVKVGSRTSINIVLASDATLLDDVIIVGYGTQRRKDLTGAITQIDNQMIETQNHSSATRVLEGSVPGVNIASIDGQPGLDAAIRVRGIGSTNIGASGALIVIDGVPAQGENPLSNMNPQDIANITVLKDAASTAVYGSRGANGVVLVTTKSGQMGQTKISFQGRWGFNSSGSMNFGQLNDAASHYEYVWRSIYNSARYGVGTSGGPKLGADGEYYTNVNSPNMNDADAALYASQHLFNYLGGGSFGRNVLGNLMAYDVPGAIYTTDGAENPSSTMSGAYLIDPATGKLNPNAKLLYNDSYRDLLLQNGFRQEYNVTASGGSDKVNYYVSIGYLEDPSFIPNSAFDRISARAKLDAHLYPWLKIGANVAYANTKTNYVGTWWAGRNYGGAQGSIMSFVAAMSPIYPAHAHTEDGSFVYDANGEKVRNYSYGGTYSPLGATARSLSGKDIVYAMKVDERSDRVDTWNARTYAEVPFLNYFKARVDLSLDNSTTTHTRYFNSVTGRAKSIGGYLGKNKYGTKIFNIQERLEYSQNIGKHHIDALALHEYNDFSTENVSWSTYQELIPGFQASANGVGRYGNAGSAPQTRYGWDIERMASFLGRANYIFADKYYLSASVRRDGSSKFKYNDTRWGTFWSVGAGWRFTEESFMRGTTNWLNNGKIRASYGVIGNQNAIGRYSGYQRWNYGTAYTMSANGKGTPLAGGQTLSLDALVNDRLTWERTNTFDLGIDLTFIDRIYFTFDFYNRVTPNSFFAQPVSTLATGQEMLQQNIAGITNRGIELDINADIIRNKDWRWNIGLNMTHYKSRLTSLPAEAIPAATDGLPEGTWLTNDGMAWGAAGFGVNKPYICYLRGVGRDWYNLSLFKYAGVDPNNGLPLYWHKVNQADLDAGRFSGHKVGDDVTTNNYAYASRYEMGDALPDIIGGFRTNLSFRNWELSANFAFQIGGKIFNKDYSQNLYAPTSGQAFNGLLVSKEVKDNTWTPDNKGAKFPMQWYPVADNHLFQGTYVSQNTNNMTDAALFSASYLRVKNVTLAYNAPKAFFDKLGMKFVSGLRIFVSADNLAIISARPGIDPSMSATGGFEIDNMPYPNMRTFTAGINLDF